MQIKVISTSSVGVIRQRLGSCGLEFVLKASSLPEGKSLRVKETDKKKCLRLYKSIKAAQKNNKIPTEIKKDGSYIYVTTIRKQESAIVIKDTEQETKTA